MFVLLFLLLLFSSQDSFAQERKSALIKFEIDFMKASFVCWSDDNTRQFIYQPLDGLSPDTLRTVDTLMDYTLDRLEYFRRVDLEPVRVGDSHHVTFFSNKLTGLPDFDLKEVIRKDMYDHLFKVRVDFKSDESPEIPGLGLVELFVAAITYDVKTHKGETEMVVTIEEYDSFGKRIAKFKQGSRMKEISEMGISKFIITDKNEALNGNDFFAFYIGALENALVFGRK